MQKVLKEAGENILVVAHGGSIRAALVGLLLWMLPPFGGLG